MQVPAVLAHRATCPTCESLFAEGPAGRPTLEAEGTPPEWRAASEALMARLPAPWYERLSESSVRLRSGLLSVLGAAVLAIGAGDLRADYSAYPEWRMALVLFCLAGAGLLGIAVSFRPLWKPRGVWLGLMPWLLATLPVLLAALPVAATGHPESLLGAEESPLLRAGRCLLFGTSLTVPLLFAWRFLDRRQGQDPMRNRVAALAATGFANAALQLHCPLTGHSHLLLGHAGLAVAGWLLALGALRLSLARGTY